MSSLAWRCPKGRQTDSQTKPSVSMSTAPGARTDYDKGVSVQEHWHIVTSLGEVITAMAGFWDVMVCCGRFPGVAHLSSR